MEMSLEKALFILHEFQQPKDCIYMPAGEDTTAAQQHKHAQDWCIVNGTLPVDL